jgi:hypothetical protein
MAGLGLVPHRLDLPSASDSSWSRRWAAHIQLVGQHWRSTGGPLTRSAHSGRPHERLARCVRRPRRCHNLGGCYWHCPRFGCFPRSSRSGASATLRSGSKRERVRGPTHREPAAKTARQRAKVDAPTSTMSKVVKCHVYDVGDRSYRLALEVRDLGGDGKATRKPHLRRPKCPCRRAFWTPACG